MKQASEKKESFTIHTIIVANVFERHNNRAQSDINNMSSYRSLNFFYT